MAIEVTTGNPRKLLRALKDDLQHGIFRSWGLDDDLFVFQEGVRFFGAFQPSISPRRLLFVANRPLLEGQAFPYSAESWALAHARLLQLILIDYRQTVVQATYVEHEHDEI